MPDTPLAHVIREEIACAPIPFPRFMELALYHPAHGYYTSGRAQVGRKGDFFTNVSVGSLYGRLMARQFVEVWQRLGEPAEFTIVEQGANTGDFAADALDGLRTLNPACFDATRYRIVEPSPTLAEKQRERLGSRPGAPACVSDHRRPAGNLIDKVEWFTTQRDLPRWTGVHFSNELIDAFPVHVVTWNGDVWMEKHVAFADGAFVFSDRPISSPRLAEACAAIPRPLIGATTEINLAARDWVAETAAQMERGCILAVDYGWERDEYHAPTRTTGTLSAYANHKREDNPLARPGEIDLTAHVNFSDLADAALACGLQIAGFTDQHHFMVGLGEHHFADGANMDDVRAFKTLMHPQFMGMAFKVIAFTKAMHGPLMGFRYARTTSIG